MHSTKASLPGAGARLLLSVRGVMSLVKPLNAFAQAKTKILTGFLLTWNLHHEHSS